MNKLKNLISIIIISLILISCASQPQYGMELKEVKYAIHQTCKVPSDMSVNITPENSMVYRGTDPLNPQIELFEFYGPTQYQGNPWYCDEPLYFFEKKLITKMERKELIESYQRKVNEQKKRLNEIEEERARAEEERRKLQEKNRVDKIVEKSKELLISNGAKIIYISGTFLIGSKGNQLVYMKEGRSVKPEEVNSEIVEYKNYLA